MKLLELAQNMDHCPKDDQILAQRDCSGYTHYKGFFMSSTGLPCVHCNYGVQEDKQ